MTKRPHFEVDKQGLAKLLWFKPTLLEPAPVGPFPQSLRLTEAADVTLVPVPAHTPGMIGVLVEDGDHTVFLAGDGSERSSPTSRIRSSDAGRIAAVAAVRKRANVTAR